MDVRQLYNQLLEEIDEESKALEEKRELLRLLKKRLATAPISGAALTLPSMAASGVGGKPFAQQVEDAIPALGGREFVVSDVAEAIRAAGIDLEEKPNSKITTVLSRMADRGELVQTFKGAGNVPNRYRNPKFPPVDGGVSGGPTVADIA